MTEEKRSVSDKARYATADSPTISGDHPKERLTEDRLGYADFARAIARSIRGIKAPEGIVLAIHGSWGSGKTTAVNMVIDALSELQRDRAENDKVINVRFNPWWFSERENLTRAFFSELNAALGTKVSEDVREKLKKIKKRVTSAKDLLLAPLSFVPAGDAAKSAANGLFNLFGEAFEDEQSLDQARKELQGALRNEGKRILVIIDDVDRLPADEARQIFRLVKSVADLPNVIYLLVFDRAIAGRAMEAPSDPGGPEWLEKIVQATFDLPPIQQIDLQQLFMEGLEKTVGLVEPDDWMRWWNVYFEAIAPWLRTPRDVGRLLNALSVSWPAVEGEVNLADFVAIETMRLFEPKLFAYIRKNGDALVLGSPIENEILSCVNHEKGQTVKMLINQLFPAMISNIYRGQEIRDSWCRQKRIFCRQRFPSYFTFSISEDVLSRAELDAFIEIVGNSQVMLEKVKSYVSQERRVGGTRAAVLLDEFGTQVDRLNADQIAPAAKNFLQHGDAFLNPSDDRSGFFQVPALSRVWRVIHALLSKLKPEVRDRVMRDAVAESPALATISHTVLSLAAEHGMHHSEELVAPESRLLPETIVSELEQALADRIKAAAEEGTLLASQNARMLMMHWKLLSGADAVRSWTDTLFGDDALIISLVKSFTGRIQRIGANDVMPTISFRVDRASLESVIDFERLLHRVVEIEKRVYSDDAAKEAIVNFHQGLKDDRYWR